MASSGFQFVYLPILKFKKGEQMVLRHLEEKDRALLLPLLELVPQGFGTIPVKDCVATAIAGLERARGDQFPAGIDVRWCSPSPARQAKILIGAFAAMQARELWVWPTLSPAMVSSELAYLKESLGSHRDVILRVPFASYLPSQLPDLLKLALGCISPRCNLHVVIDLEAITGSDPEAIATQCAPYCKTALAFPRVRDVTLAGGSFPYNLVGLPRGRVKIPRVEWKVWRKVRASPALRAVTFGDYAVTNPQPMEVIDPEKMNPSVSIRYAQRDHWLVLKGVQWRPNGHNEYHNLCSLLTQDPIYYGRDYSYGDRSYDEFASVDGGGSPYVWRRDATSHHVVLTARSVSTLSES